MQALKLNYNTQQHELRDYQEFTQRRQKNTFWHKPRMELDWASKTKQNVWNFQ